MLQKNKKILLLLCINLCLFFLLINRIQLVSSAAVNADIIVAKDGTGNFTTIQAAIDSVPSNSSKRTVIFVKNGTYKEVVTIRKNNIHLIGESNTKTIITYDNYAGKLKPDGTTYGTSGSASFYLMKQIIKNCIFIGNQDTLYAHSGRQYYVNCKIIGDTDFIFGGATAVFENCEIVSTPKGGYVTAASSRKLRISVLKLQIDKRCSQKFNISWKTLASQCICSLQNMLFGSAYKGVRLDQHEW